MTLKAAQSLQGLYNFTAPKRNYPVFIKYKESTNRFHSETHINNNPHNLLFDISTE